MTQQEYIEIQKRQKCNAFQGLGRLIKYTFNYTRYSSRAEFWWGKFWFTIVELPIFIVYLCIDHTTDLSSLIVPSMGNTKLKVLFLIIFYILSIPMFSLRLRRFLDAGLRKSLAWLMMLVRFASSIALIIIGSLLFPDFIWLALFIASLVIEMLPTGRVIIQNMQAQYNHYQYYNPYMIRQPSAGYIAQQAVQQNPRYRKQITRRYQNYQNALSNYRNQIRINGQVKNNNSKANNKRNQK